jgi:cyclomaltodextrinase
VPGWVEHAVCWHLFPLGFLGAEAVSLPPDVGPHHRLRRLEPWLDYLVELGASALLLGPIFESSSHGYDTVDYFAIDRRLGDDADYDAVVDAAHQRGVRVLLDGVFNHVSREFPLFQQALHARPDLSAAQWFHLLWPDGAGEPEYEHFEGHKQLVTLNHEAPQVVDFVVEVMSHWLDRGADGWRLDAAYAVPPQFWAAVLPRVRERHPDAFIFGEVIHGDYAGFVAESGVDSVTQYELWKAMWSSLNDRNFHELAWTLTRHDEMLESFVPVTFVGNHDVTRIATKLTDPTTLAHALVILFTLGGLPCVYAGDEQGFTGTKEDRAGGDDAVRPAFPDSPAELSPIGRPILDLHKELIGLRRRNPWLYDAKTVTEHVSNDHLVYRSERGGDALLVALNVADEPATLPASLPGQVLAGEARLSPTASGVDVTLPAKGWAIIGSGNRPAGLSALR